MIFNWNQLILFQMRHWSCNPSRDIIKMTQDDHEINQLTS